MKSKIAKKMFAQKSTVQILDLILDGYSQDANTENALEVFLFAKKVANAAAIAQKLTGDAAAARLAERGGKGENHFAKYHIKRVFQTTYHSDELRESLIAQITEVEAIMKPLTSALAEREKQMGKDGLVDKLETGQSIVVSLTDKI